MPSHFRHYAALALVLATAAGSAAASSGATARQQLASIGNTLKQTPCYSDSCSYQVLLPNLSEPVVYSVALESTATPADTLSPCSYIIRWRFAAPSNGSRGFSAYFGGNHFRFSNNRLQEYHAPADIESLAPASVAANGVQRKVQFAELLPQFIGEHLVRMSSDTTYTFTVQTDVRREGTPAVRIEGKRRIAGCDALEFEYILAQETYMPLAVELENNPGQIGEQTVTVRYGRAPSTTGCSISMERLTALEPEAFEKYRTASFSLEQLVGNPLPLIAVPTADGGRYIHHKGEAMGAPTVLVFCNLQTATTPDVVGAVRRAVSQVPGYTEVVWMFPERHAEDVVAATGPSAPGETVVINAGSAVRDLGVGAVMPVIVLVDRAGNVSDFIRGFNNDLENIVIQKATLSAMSR